MGGGKSSSKTSTDKSTKVTTTTTTNIRDIGLTGGDAVELAAILQEGVAAQTLAIGEIINPLIQEAGAGFRQLTAGASDLVKTVGTVATGGSPAGEANEFIADLGKKAGEFAPLALAAFGAFFIFRELAK